MEETGVANVADPLGGSWYVEALTDQIEAEAEEIFARIRRRWARDGTMTAGILRGIEDGWFTGEIAEAAFQYQQALEKGEKKVVGVNATSAAVAGDLEILRFSGEVEREQVRALARPARRPRRRRRPDTLAARWSTPPARTPTWSRRCWRPRAPRRPSARSAARCGMNGAATPSPPASEQAPAAAGLGGMQPGSSPSRGGRSPRLQLPALSVAAGWPGAVDLVRRFKARQRRRGQRAEPSRPPRSAPSGGPAAPVTVLDVTEATSRPRCWTARSARR